MSKSAHIPQSFLIIQLSEDCCGRPSCRVAPPGLGDIDDCLPVDLWPPDVACIWGGRCCVARLRFSGMGDGAEMEVLGSAGWC